MGEKSKSGGGSTKVGRDKKKCERYKNMGRREINKMRKIKNHLKNYPNDKVAQGVLKCLAVR